MGYTIELSFNARKHNNVTTLKTRIDNMAYEYNCNGVIRCTKLMGLIIKLQIIKVLR